MIQQELHQTSHVPEWLFFCAVDRSSLSIQASNQSTQIRTAFHIQKSFFARLSGGNVGRTAFSHQMFLFTALVLVASLRLAFGGCLPALCVWASLVRFRARGFFVLPFFPVAWVYLLSACILPFGSVSAVWCFSLLCGCFLSVYTLPLARLRFGARSFFVVGFWRVACLYFCLGSIPRCGARAFFLVPIFFSHYPVPQILDHQSLTLCADVMMSHPQVTGWVSMFKSLTDTKLVG